MNDTDYELTGEAEHNDFMMGSEDMELRAMRLETEREAKQEAAMAEYEAEEWQREFDAKSPEEKAHYWAANEEFRWRLAAGLVDVDADMDDLLAPECDGHYPGPYDPMGQTVYCDGSCKAGR